MFKFWASDSKCSTLSLMLRQTLGCCLHVVIYCMGFWGRPWDLGWGLYQANSNCSASTLFGKPHTSVNATGNKMKQVQTIVEQDVTGSTMLNNSQYPQWIHTFNIEFELIGNQFWHRFLSIHHGSIFFLLSPGHTQNHLPGPPALGPMGSSRDLPVVLAQAAGRVHGKADVGPG